MHLSCVALARGADFCCGLDKAKVICLGEPAPGAQGGRKGEERVVAQGSHPHPWICVSEAFCKVVTVPEPAAAGKGCGSALLKITASVGAVFCLVGCSLPFVSAAGPALRYRRCLVPDRSSFVLLVAWLLGVLCFKSSRVWTVALDLR